MNIWSINMNSSSATTVVCWLRRRDDEGFPDESMLQSVTVTSVHYGAPEWPNKTCAAAVKLRNSTLFYLLMLLVMLWSLLSSHHLHLNLKMFSRPEWIWRCWGLTLIPSWQNWTWCSKRFCLHPSKLCCCWSASRFQWKVRKNIPSSRFWVCPGLLSYAHREKSRRPLHQNRSISVDFSQSDSALSLFLPPSEALLWVTNNSAAVFWDLSPRWTAADDGV